MLEELLGAGFGIAEGEEFEMIGATESDEDELEDDFDDFDDDFDDDEE